ncbi:MAG: trigger factor [Nitrospinota bacterium]
MKVELEDLGQCTRHLKIEIPSEVFTKEVDIAYSKLKKKVKIHGFRQGKIPRKVLEKYYSKDVENDALQKIIPETYEKAIKDYKLRVVGEPKLDNIKVEKEKTLCYTATVEVLPDIELKEYDGLEFTRRNVNISDEDVENELKRLQEAHAEFDNVPDRPVKDSDYVIIDFEGFAGGISLKGGKGVNQPLVIGSGTFVKEFEEGLINMNKEEEKDIRVSFASDFHNKEIAGKDVVFKVRIKEIKEKRLLKLDDAFAKEIGRCETIKELGEKVRENLEKNERLNADARLKGEITDRLVELNPFEPTKGLIENQMDFMAENAKRHMMYQKSDEDKSDIDIKNLREGFRESATKIVAGELLLEEISKKEGVEVTDEDIDKEVKRIAVLRNEAVNVLKVNMRKDGTLERLRSQIKREKILNTLINKFKISEVFVDRSEIIQDTN